MRPTVQAVQDRQPVHYARLSHQALDDPRLDANAIRVLLAIARFANWQHGTCWPGIATISRVGRFSDQKHRDVFAGIRLAESLGYLEVTRRNGRPNIYALTLPPSTGGGVKPEPPPIDTGTTPRGGGYHHPHEWGSNELRSEREKKPAALAGTFGSEPTPEQIARFREALKRRRKVS
jgi:hypothetical protein